MDKLVITPLDYFVKKKEQIIKLVKDYIENNCVEFKKQRMGDFLETEIDNSLEKLIDLAPQDVNEGISVGEGDFSASLSGLTGGKGKYSDLNFSNN